MEVYINGLSSISHHQTFDDNFIFENALSEKPSTNNFVATEPNYKELITGNSLRRMSRVVKMGLSTTFQSMKKAGVDNVDAIIVGTGIGCFEDTDKFLRSFIDNNEEMLTPTAFIQSTHNTVAGQIALHIKCYGYNFTYVHQNLSFESALFDAMMMLNEKNAATILVGGIDESNSNLLELFDRANHIKSQDNLQPVWEKGKGYILGEGSAFFVLSSTQSPHSVAKVNGVKYIQSIKNGDELLSITNLFLQELNIDLSEIDLVLSGNCGDELMDKNIVEFNNKLKNKVAYFKNLCGEYFTSSAFALLLSVEIMNKQKIPSALNSEGFKIGSIKKIVIVNHYHGKQYSLTCITKC